MFVVAMTIAVLASVGVFALAAAATEVKTSGNERQATQTHFLASYGVLGAAQEIKGTRAQWYLGLMLSQPDSCPLSLPGAAQVTTDPATLACRRLGASEMQNIGAWLAPPTMSYSATPFAPGVPPGSLGPVPMSADFFVEVTEPTQAKMPARYATSLNFCFIRFTATAAGITEPVYASNGTGQHGTEGIEVQRARFVAGPMQCPR